MAPAIHIPEALRKIVVGTSRRGRMQFLLTKVVQGKGEDGSAIAQRVYPLAVDMQAKAWLPCPSTDWLLSSSEDHAAICKYEGTGGLEKVKLWLQQPENVFLWKEFKKQHEQCARERWEILLDEHKVLARQKSWTSALEDTGIGGILNFSDPRSIKCLHLHYANFLLSDGANVVGHFVSEQLHLSKAHEGTI